MANSGKTMRGALTTAMLLCAAGGAGVTMFAMGQIDRDITARIRAAGEAKAETKAEAKTDTGMKPKATAPKTETQSDASDDKTAATETTDTAQATGTAEATDTDKAKAPGTDDAQPAQTGAATETPPAGPKVITIRYGDTLSSISLETGVSVDELAAANGIRDVNLIYADSSLQIPGAK